MAGTKTIFTMLNMSAGLRRFLYTLLNRKGIATCLV